ncbi:MAG TPA: hypothetical protein VF151_10800 [Gemmatimonadales bacterium]
MKIALLGSAGSLPQAPFNDPGWHIWGCSPGVYPFVGRVNAWFELHRWEPGHVGKPGTQKPWFSPEYVQWMKMIAAPANVWMAEHHPDIPQSKALPIDDLRSKYGSYFLTSSISIMFACAIDDILENRDNKRRAGVAEFEPDVIGLWGVDMSANEEYGYQRAGCQHFALLAADLGIEVYVPPESDLLRPMPVYGLCESEHWHIKMTLHKRELEARRDRAAQTAKDAEKELHFVNGAIDELTYQMSTWGEQRPGIGTAHEITAMGPQIRAAVHHREAFEAEDTARAKAQREHMEQQSGSADSHGTQAVETGAEPVTSAKRRSSRKRR